MQSLSFRIRLLAITQLTVCVIALSPLVAQADPSSDGGSDGAGGSTPFPGQPGPGGFIYEGPTPAGPGPGGTTPVPGQIGPGGFIYQGPIPASKAPRDISDIDWSLWDYEARHRIALAMREQWRRNHPEGSAGGSTDAYRVYAETVDSILYPEFRSIPPPESPEVRAGWEALQRAPSEVSALGPVLYETAKSSFRTESLKQAAAAVAGIGAGVVEGARGTFGVVRMSAALLADAPKATYVALEYYAGLYYSGTGVETLMRQAADAGIELTESQAKQFLDGVATINEAALKGDDRKVAEVFGRFAGQQMFGELLGVGMLKAAQQGKDAVRAVSRSVSETFERAVEGTLGAEIRAAKQGSFSIGELTVQELEANGIDAFTAQHLDAIAKETGTLIEVRPGNGAGLEWIVNGKAVPKPEALAAAKTATPADRWLGTPSDAEGLAIWQRPLEPPAGAPVEAYARYQERMKAWHNTKNQDLMEWLQLDPATRGGVPAGFPAEYSRILDRGQVRDLQIRIDDRGVIWDVQRNKPVGPDIDLAAIRDASTGQLASPEKVAEVCERLKLAANIQHGGYSHWTDAPAAVQEKLFWNHSYSNGAGVPHLQFGGTNSGLPIRNWADLQEAKNWAVSFPNAAEILSRIAGMR